MAFYHLSVRDIANYSPPAIELADGVLPEWEILLRIAGIAAGQDADTVVDALDDLVASTLAQRLATTSSSPVTGRDDAGSSPTGRVRSGAALR